MPTIKVVPFPGAPGPRGEQGPRGYQGDQGLSGLNGTDGKSAYEIAVDNGFQGTEQQWLDSLGGDGIAEKVLPAGGTAGQILSKVDETDYNAEWTNVSDVFATSTRWSPTFEATGLTFTGTDSAYPTYESYYVKVGKMVTFNIAIDLSTVTNFGTGQFKTELPFLPIPSAANHFSAWAWIDPTQPADELNGHIQMVADNLPNSQVLDLHWLKETTATPKPLIESILSQGTPVTFTTASKIYINGTYIAA